MPETKKIVKKRSTFSKYLRGAASKKYFLSALAFAFLGCLTPAREARQKSRGEKFLDSPDTERRRRRRRRWNPF